jgi:hypothetical protein
MLMDVLMDVLTDMQWIEEHKFAAWTKLDFSVCRSCVGLRKLKTMHTIFTEYLCYSPNNSLKRPILAKNDRNLLNCSTLLSCVFRSGGGYCLIRVSKCKFLVVVKSRVSTPSPVYQSAG